MPSLFRSSLFGLVAATSSVAGCDYKHHESGVANGSDGQLYFAVNNPVQSNGLGTVPIGATRTVWVSRNSGGNVDCHGIGIRNVDAPLTPQSGPPIPIPLPPNDRCTDLPSEPVGLVSAACEDDACLVEDLSANGGVSVRIKAKSETATTTRLVVTVKKTQTGEVFTDSIAVAFAKPARIKLVTGTRAAEAFAIGRVMPGISVQIPTAVLVDDASQPMSIDDAVTRASDGSALPNDDGYASSFEAKTLGKTTIRWEVPGVMSRTLDVEVVDPAESTSVIVSAPPAGTREPSDYDSVDLDDPKTALLPLTQIEARSDVQPAYRAYVVTKDGRTAVAPIKSVTTEPSALAIKTDTLAWKFFLLEFPVAGSGSVTIAVGDVSTTLPLVVVTPRSW
jgi:hypothetical protein